jgi:hypothetical protein
MIGPGATVLGAGSSVKGFGENVEVQSSGFGLPALNAPNGRRPGFCRSKPSVAWGIPSFWELWLGGTRRIRTKFWRMGQHPNRGGTWGQGKRMNCQSQTFEVIKGQ